jgi:hypothetical protein
VDRIVLVARGFPAGEIYKRGTTWGQFITVTPSPSTTSHLAIYGRHRKLLQTIPLNLAPGTQRVLR